MYVPCKCFKTIFFWNIFKWPQGSHFQASFPWWIVKLNTFFYLSIVLFVASEIMVHSSGSRNLYLGYIWLTVFKLSWLHHAVSCGTNCSPTKSHYAYPPTTKPENSVLLILAKHRATNFKAILIFQSISIHLKICA